MSNYIIKSLELLNFHKFSEIKVDFDESRSFFVGGNGAGKSTLGSAAIWAIINGVGERGNNLYNAERFRMIGEKSASAKGILTLKDTDTDDTIRVERKITKDANTIKIESESGKVLDQTWLSSLFSEYMFAPKRFIDLPGVEQAKALGVNTVKFDQALKELKAEYTTLNRIYKEHGLLEEVEEPKVTGDITDLLAQRDEITAHNGKIDLAHAKQKEISDKILALELELVNLNAQQGKIEAWLSDKKPIDLADINAKIASAQENSQAKAKYDAYLAKKAKMEVDFNKIKANKEAQENTIKQRLDCIQEAKLPFKNMTISDEGELLINDKPLKSQYFSYGELLKIMIFIISTMKTDLKYCFIENWMMLDEENQKVILDLLAKHK